MSTLRLRVLWCEHQNGIPRQGNHDKCQRPGQLLRYTIDMDVGSRRDNSLAGLGKETVGATVRLPLTVCLLWRVELGPC